MANYLGDFFRSRRIDKALSLGDLARLAGYRNVNKGVRRILRFERDGTITDGLLAVLAEVLEIDWCAVQELAEQDRQERLRTWEAWANQPIQPYLIVRYLAAIYGRNLLSDDVQTAERAEAFACNYAKEHRWRVCLVLSRRQCVWISASGEIERREETGPDLSAVQFSHVRGDGRSIWFHFTN